MAHNNKGRGFAGMSEEERKRYGRQGGLKSGKATHSSDNDEDKKEGEEEDKKEGEDESSS